MKTPPLPVPGSAKRARSQDSRLNVPPATPPLTTESGVENMRAPLPSFLNLTRLQIAARFHDLEWKQRFRLSHAMQNPDSPWRIDKSSIITARNRYMNIQPWAKSRIQLRVPSGQSDYVNASPIRLKDSKGNGTENYYIATQGPKDTSHFWHMVFHECQDPAVVIMLTQTHEGAREKCAQYYPLSTSSPTMPLPAPNKSNESEASTPSEETPHDPFFVRQEPLTRGTIELLSVTEDPTSRSEIRKLKLTIGDQSKTVFHYLFTRWADFGKPEGEDRQALLELIKQTQSKVGDPSTNPRVVHCSAGVGRTGTFIALDYLMKELEVGAFHPSSLAQYSKQTFKQTSPSSPSPPSTSSEMTDRTTSDANGHHTTPHQDSAGPNPKSKDKEKEETTHEEDIIFQTVNILREQRMMMVMNELQFSFIYEVVKEAYERKYISPSSSSGGEGEAEKEGEGPRSPKIARKTSYAESTEEVDDKEFGGIGDDIYVGTHVAEGHVQADEDTVSP